MPRQLGGAEPGQPGGRHRVGTLARPSGRRGAAGACRGAAGRGRAPGARAPVCQRSRRVPGPRALVPRAGRHDLMTAMAEPSARRPACGAPGGRVPARRRAGRPAGLVAGGQLPVGRADLPAGQPAAARAADAEHIKPRLLGHWGTTPGLNFIYAHLNRVDPARDLDMLYVTGPGHGGPALVANSLARGHLQRGLPRRQPRRARACGGCSASSRFPAASPATWPPETPGSIHEGGELGYALSHAFGAAFDNPDLIVACVVGDGEAETGPLATSWHSNKFLDPVGDGAVLPILHLNGYKIANPTVLARIPRGRAGRSCCAATATSRTSSTATTRRTMHQAVRRAPSTRAWTTSRDDPGRRAREQRRPSRPRWPMIVLRTPKGWTGPKEVDGSRSRAAGAPTRCRSPTPASNPEHRAVLETLDAQLSTRGALRRRRHPRARARGALSPVGDRRMSAIPHANGGLLRRALRLPDFRDARRRRPLPRYRERRGDRGARPVPARRDGPGRRPDLPGLRPRREQPRSSRNPSTVSVATLPPTLSLA